MKSKRPKIYVSCGINQNRNAPSKAGYVARKRIAGVPSYQRKQTPNTESKS